MVRIGHVMFAQPLELTSLPGYRTHNRGKSRGNEITTRIFLFWVDIDWKWLDWEFNLKLRDHITKKKTELVNCSVPQNWKNSTYYIFVFNSAHRSLGEKIIVES